MVEGKINFRKREIIFNSIWQLLKFRSDSYKFTKVEPIFTFLWELPYASENDLFRLSLYVEPRAVSQTQSNPPQPMFEKSGSFLISEQPQIPSSDKQSYSPPDPPTDDQ